MQAKGKVTIDSRAESRNDKGLWVLHRVSRGVAVYGCFGLGYKVRVAGKMLKQLSDTISSREGFEEMTDSQFESAFKGDAKRIAEEYKDLAKVDKVTAANDKAEQCIKIAENNIGKLVSGMDDLDRLHGKSKDTVAKALEFQKNTDTLKKEMSWLNKKNLIFSILGVGAAGGFLYVWKFM